MTRKHMKVEPDRWYYWCDKLGLLVWQDMPAAAAGTRANKNKETGVLHVGVRVSEEANIQFETELKAMVEQHLNHPSIIMWIIFDENWDQYDTVRLTQFTRQLDPTRLVNDASGFVDFKVGDVIVVHNYDTVGKPNPIPKPEPNRASVLGEFGGISLLMPGHTWADGGKGWGYKSENDTAKLTETYLSLWKQVLGFNNKPGLSAPVYTQITDVETECNGLMTYDRKVVKVDLDKASAGVTRGGVQTYHKLPEPSQNRQ